MWRPIRLLNEHIPILYKHDFTHEDSRYRITTQYTFQQEN